MTALDRCLGFSKDLTDFYEFADKDGMLSLLVRRFLGLKPPRFPTVLEAAVNGIACQQVSLNLGIVLLNRLASTYGLAVLSGSTKAHAFPRPEDLSDLKLTDFRKLGFSRQKRAAIIELSRSVTSGRLAKRVFQRICKLHADIGVVEFGEAYGVGT